MKREIVLGAVLIWLLGAAIVVPGVVCALDGGNCTPIEVATLFNQRVHVKCATNIGGFVYFAVPTSSSDMANQVLSLATTALTNNKTLGIQFDKNDNSGPAYGCDLSDCRPLQGLQLFR
jgi:hypothetical protein